MTISSTLVQSIMTNCVATTIANVTSGRTTSGIVAFESNVVESETGSDFQTGCCDRDVPRTARRDNRTRRR